MAAKTQELVRQDAEATQADQQQMTAFNFMPVMNIAQAIQRYDDLLEFTKKIMKPGVHYGEIPGTDKPGKPAKPTLLKPGAEKLCNFFGLTPRFEIVEKIEDWDGVEHTGEPLFYYWYRCGLWRFNHLIAEADGSCNSREAKYRYRWVPPDQVPRHVLKEQLQTRGGRISEFEFAVEKSDSSGKYGKPPEYWQQFHDAIANRQAKSIKKKLRDGTEKTAWEIDATVFRLTNPDICDVVNTLQKMGQKRSLIGVALIGCNASEYFTQDLDDMEPIDVPYVVLPREPIQVSTKGEIEPTNARAKPEPTKPDAKSSPAPAPLPTTFEEMPERVTALRARITDKQSSLEVFSEYQFQISELAGTDEPFLEVLSIHGVERPDQFRTLGMARSCAVAMMYKVRELNEQGAKDRQNGVGQNDLDEVLAALGGSDGD